MTEQGTPSPCESCPKREFCGSVEHCESWRQWFGKRWDEVREAGRRKRAARERAFLRAKALPAWGGWSDAPAGAERTLQRKGEDIVPKTYTCPFWKWDKGKAMSCECCRMNFPDGDAKREYIERYCASLEGWQKCSIAGNLLTFYERTDQP